MSAPVPILKEAVYDPARCPSFHDHTPCPPGYIDWHAWARRMMRTHKQIRCTGCGLFSIWVPRAATPPRAGGRK